MREIPEDVMKAATEAYECYDGMAYNASLLIDSIARAIMAERERCIKIVRCGCENPACELDEAADRIERGDQT